VTWLLLAWMALLSADRIDLLGGRGAFVLTPFLVLTPLVIAAEWLRHARAHRTVTMPRNAVLFLLLALTLVALAVLSVFVSGDVRSSASRLAQLLIMIGGTCTVLLLSRDRANLPALLAAGARVGIVSFALFDVLQLLAWREVVPMRVPEAAPMLQLSPDLYAGIVPRLSGLVLDSNRGGLLLVLFGWIIAADARESTARRGRAPWWLALTALLLVCTLSRSAMLAAAGAAACAWWQGRAARRTVHRTVLPATSLALPTFRLALALLLAGSSAALLVSPPLRDAVLQAAAPLQQRFTVLEGSSQDHLRLIARGVATATQSLATVTQGIGYGSSHVVLQDFFPGDRYGNFHSVYVGIFAESGVFALVVVVLLIGVPLVRDGPFRPLVVALALFGLFYGALPEPAFWWSLALAWLSWAPSTSRPKAITSATATPSTSPSSN
jgi:hypothetical protein